VVGQGVEAWVGSECGFFYKEGLTGAWERNKVREPPSRNARAMRGQRAPSESDYPPRFLICGPFHAVPCFTPLHASSSFTPKGAFRPCLRWRTRTPALRQALPRAAQSSRLPFP
jgi:hypothetical protein